MWVALETEQKNYRFKIFEKLEVFPFSFFRPSMINEIFNP